MKNRPFSLALAAAWLLSLLATGGIGWWMGKRAGSHAAAASSQIDSTPIASASDGAVPAATGAAKPKSIALATQDEMPLTGLKRAEAALRLKNKAQRRRAFFAFLDTMTADQVSDVEKIIHALNLEGVELPDEWSAFISRWGEIDPRSALAEMQRRRTRGDSESLIGGAERNIISAWASLNPQQAQAWLEAQPDTPGKASLWTAIIDSMSQSDVEAATALALKHTAGDKNAQSSAMEVLAESAVQQRGLDGMRAWFAELPDNAKAAAMIHVQWRNTYFQRDEAAPDSLEKNAAWLASQASSSWREDRFYQELAGRWAQKDPQAAAQWSASLPPGKDPGNPFPGLRSSVATWVEKNPDEVSAWLGTQQGQPYYDTAAAGVAQHYLQQGGEEDVGQTWLDSISSPEIKQRVLDAVSERRAQEQYYEVMRKSKERGR